MSGQVLIVDPVAARRVLMRASLQAAHYRVCEAADPAAVPALMETEAPDLVLIDAGDDEQTAIGVICAVKDRASAPTPVIVLTPPGRSDLRVVALRVGADEAMDRGTSDIFLKARIRSLLRARHAAAEMGLREDDGPGGFGEERPAVGPAAPCGGRVAVVVTGHPRPRRVCGGLPPALAALPDALDCEVAVLSPADDLGEPASGVPDLFVIDGSAAARDPQAGPEALRLLAELRSRPLTRHAATLIVLPGAAVETAAMALDMGAGDVAAAAARPEELAARARALIGRKSQADRLRDRIQSRLQAAVRDPLTGLYNRRHAEPALARMAERARAAGREVAVMVVDIDHFKAVNDTWGHAAGDRVLAEVARRLQGAVRSQDLVARLGGEEFLVALPDSSADAALAAAERLRRVVDGRPFAVARGRGDARGPEAPAGGDPAGRAEQAAPVPDGRTDGAAAGVLAEGFAPPAARGDAGINASVSIGVAVGSARLTGKLALVDLFERADDALYAAKQAGRNRVAMAPGAD